MKSIIRLIFLILLISFYFSCDHGLAPPEEEIPPEPTGIAGTLYFRNWPPPDSLFDLRLVVFKNYPPTNILGELLSGNAFVYPPLDSTNLPFYVDSLQYLMKLPAGRYEYVVVAQQFGPNLYSDWRAVGQYDTDTDSLPTPIEVKENRLLKGIDVFVDFKNLPVQPF